MKTLKDNNNYISIEEHIPSKSIVIQQPIFILVRPQMGENIGAVARVMANFGIENLRIINPRDGWVNEKALTTAKNAKHIIEQAEIFDNINSAISDCNYIYVTSSRTRDLVKPIFTPREAAKKIITNYNNHNNCKIAIIFGPENSGLENEDIIHSDAIITIPVNLGYTSLNLAQAAAIMSYEFCINQINLSTDKYLIPKINEHNLPTDHLNASKEEIFNMVDFINNILNEKEYFKNSTAQTNALQNLNNIFSRANLSSAEVNFLRGILNAICCK